MSVTGDGMNDLPEDLALVRDTYGTFKTATYEFAQACIEAKRNGRSLRQIAEAADEKANKDTVRRAILAVASCDSPDEFDRKYGEVVAETSGNRKRKLKSGSEGTTGRSAPPAVESHEPEPIEDFGSEVVNAEIVYGDEDSTLPEYSGNPVQQNGYDIRGLFTAMTNLHGRLLAWPLGEHNDMAEAYMTQIISDMNRIKEG
jgi:hypothetical protein